MWAVISNSWFPDGDFVHIGRLGEIMYVIFMILTATVIILVGIFNDSDMLIAIAGLLLAILGILVEILFTLRGWTK